MRAPTSGQDRPDTRGLGRGQSRPGAHPCTALANGSIQRFTPKTGIVTPHSITPVLGADQNTWPALSWGISATFGRPFHEPLPWLTGAESNTDMSATTDEPRGQIVLGTTGRGRTRTQRFDTPALDVIGHVQWWPSDRTEVTGVRRGEGIITADFSTQPNQPTTAKPALLHAPEGHNSSTATKEGARTPEKRECPSQRPGHLTVEVLAAYSHSTPAADLRLCHTMALNNPVRAPGPSATRP